MASKDNAGNQKQKLARQSSVSGLVNQSHQSPMQPSPQRLETDEYKPMFYAEIASIMRGFGDSDHPIKESIILVDKILMQQLRGILQDVIDLAMERKRKPEPSLKDFYFLMRKNPTKMYRLQKHLEDIKWRQKYQEIMDGQKYQGVEGHKVNYEDELEANRSSDDEVDRSIQEKYDEEKQRRLFRADRISQMLNSLQYKEYNEARRTSFYCRNSAAIRTKLREWLKPPKEVLLSNQVFTILSFLAHETVAAIVDYCILTRLDSSNRQTEPYSRVTSSGNSYNMLHLCPEVTQGRGLDGIKPITVQEIHEAMRRHAMCSTKTMGLYRNIDGNRNVPHLAV